MKKIKYYLFIIFFMLILLYSNDIFASSAYLSASTSSVNIGDEFNVSIILSDISAATLTTRVSVDTNKVQYVSGPANSNFSNGRVIYSWTDSTGGANPITGGTIATFTFRAVSSGSAYFGISGEFFNSDEETISVGYSGTSVNVVEPAPPTVEIPPVIEEPPAEEPPIVENTPIVEEPIETPWEENNNNQSSSNEKSSNANLKSMQLDVVGISPNFNKNTTTYWITVPTSITTINVTAVPEDSNATVKVEGNENLVNGKNYIYIRVTAEDRNTVKTYTINVIRDDNEEASNANLESLAIEGVTLVPEFNEDVIEYTAELKEKLEKLNILAFPKYEGASVKIEGNENLVEGENIVKIIVTSQNGENEKIYTVKINNISGLEEEKSIENENRNIDNTNLYQTKKNNKIKNIVLTVLIIIIVIVIAIIIIKKYKEKNRKY